MIVESPGEEDWHQHFRRTRQQAEQACLAHDGGPVTLRLQTMHISAAAQSVIHREQSCSPAAMGHALPDAAAHMRR